MDTEGPVWVGSVWGCDDVGPVLQRGLCCKGACVHLYITTRGGEREGRGEGGVASSHVVCYSC